MHEMKTKLMKEYMNQMNVLELKCSFESSLISSYSTICCLFIADSNCYLKSWLLFKPISVSFS